MKSTKYKNFTFQIYSEGINEEGFLSEIAYTVKVLSYTKGRPAKFNCWPPEPEESPEIDFEITDEKGNEITPDDDMYEKVYEKVLEHEDSAYQDYLDSKSERGR